MEKLFGFKSIWINGFQIHTGKIVFKNLSETLTRRLEMIHSSDIIVDIHTGMNVKTGSFTKYTVMYTTNDYNRSLIIKASLWSICKSHAQDKLNKKYQAY
jgi:hypothetical protein